MYMYLSQRKEKTLFQFVSVPTYHGQGMAKDLKPMMHKLIGVFAQRIAVQMQGGAGPSNGAAAPGHKRVKRMRGD